MSEWLDPTQDLEDLILWLATTYGDNDPIWPLHDAFGHLLEANIRLAATWFRVVRAGVMPVELEQATQSHAEVPSEKGEKR